MTSRLRRWMIWTGSALAALALIAVALTLVLQSDWFFSQVREKLVSTLETATGGRVEIGAFHFYWKELRAEVRDLVIHGTEPAGKPPLLRASRIDLRLRILSVLYRQINLAALDVTRPEIYLIVGPEGRTNVPEPKVRKTGGPATMDTILDLAIGRFSVTNGVAEVEGRTRTPIDARGENLRALFQYEAAGSRYRGQVAMSPLRMRLPDLAPLELGVTLELALERNRVQIASAQVTSGASQVLVSGALEDFDQPHGSFHYRVLSELRELMSVLESRTELAGTVVVEGDGTYKGGNDLAAEGALHAYDIEFRDGTVRLRGGRADGKIDATLERVNASGLRISTVYSDRDVNLPAGVQVRSLILKGKDLEAQGVAVAAAGGTFRGEAGLRDFDRYNVRGSLAGFEIRRLVALYNQEPLPWDGRLSGTARLEGRLKARNSAVLDAGIQIAPALQGPPVSGQAAVHYDARLGVLDLGRSHLELPHTRLTASGAVNSRLQVHLETNDLNDLLPALRAPNLPLRIESGAVVFDGSVSGKLDAPQVSGKVTSGRISYAGTSVDALQADVNASPELVAGKNVHLTRGALRARGQGSIGLTDWKVADASPVSADLEVANAPVSDLLDAANQKAVDLTGVLSASLRVGGTAAKPSATADLTLVKGSFAGEPFDRFTAKAAYADRVFAVSQGQIAAGTRRVDLSGSYGHADRDLARGRLLFKISTNTMELDEFRVLEKARPGIRGTVIANAGGALEVVPPQPGRAQVRLDVIEADIRGRGLQMTGQPLGDFRLTATSEGNRAQARFASDFANSRIRGEGQWKLADDYPGSAKITFTRLDFQQLRAWIAPKQSHTQFDLGGSAEGELQIEGPATNPEAWKAELRIPKVELGPTANSTLAGKTPLLLRNEGPIVATMANRVVTMQSGRLVGPATDLQLTGKAMLQSRNALDLRVIGRVDLGILQNFDADLYAAGSLTADAAIRGSLDSPQVNGRVELKNASFNLADAPNGLANAQGVILFTGDRATIQSLTGETGGGKVTLSGFASYGSGETVFRVDASAEEVRVRYPEGVSTVADAELNLTGTSSRSMLTGTVTILRTGFNPQSDFSNVLAKSAEPVRTASTRTGFLGGLNFDILIETSPDLTVQSSLTEGVQMEANLRLRGTASNPAVLGRINITQGQLAFFGTKYTINQGSIAFYNPVKVEPVLNVDLETRARGVDVTLTVSGPLNKLQLTPRSDPPLQFSEIVALLATGRAPTSDPTLVTQQTAAGTQNWQQMGASALLGQAIANPVAGRLQRFFGVSKLKIDPSLTGVENNPQARLTLEQQVTQNVTFTYITDVTSTNPLVVRVEWAFAPRWSVVAVREENGLVGIDFLYKKRFK